MKWWWWWYQQLCNVNRCLNQFETCVFVITIGVCCFIFLYVLILSSNFIFLPMKGHVFNVFHCNNACKCFLMKTINLFNSMNLKKGTKPLRIKIRNKICDWWGWWLRWVQLIGWGNKNKNIFLLFLVGCFGIYEIHLWVFAILLQIHLIINSHEKEEEGTKFP